MFFSLADKPNSKNFGRSSIGILSTQKKPLSSRIFNADDFPEPEIPLTNIILGFAVFFSNTMPLRISFKIVIIQAQLMKVLRPLP